MPPFVRKSMSSSLYMLGKITLTFCQNLDKSVSGILVFFMPTELNAPRSPFANFLAISSPNPRTIEIKIAPTSSP